MAWSETSSPVDFSTVAGEYESMERVTGSTWNRTNITPTCPPSHLSSDQMRMYYANIVVLSIIFITALLSNACVLLAVWLKRGKNTRMHMFIVHLACADIIVALFQVLPELILRFTCVFKSHDAVCRLEKYLQVVGMYGSTYVLVCTAMDRYFAIKHPMQTFRQSKNRVHITIGMAWMISLIFSIPQLIFFGISEGSTRCKMYGLPIEGIRLYVTWCFISIMVIPVILLSYFYGMIAAMIYKNIQDKRKASEPEQNPLNLEPNQKAVFAPRASNVRIASRAKIKTVKMTFVIVVLYVVCYMPFFGAQVLGVWGLIPRNSHVSEILHLLSALNSCVNPWVYMGFSGHLLDELKRFFLCRKKPGQNQSHSQRAFTSFTNVASK